MSLFQIVQLFTLWKKRIAFSEKIGFPIIVRPAYTLGGSGGGITDNLDDFKELVRGGFTGKSDYTMFN